MELHIQHPYTHMCGRAQMRHLNRVWRLVLLVGLVIAWPHGGSSQSGTSRYAVWITLNPNDCLTSTGVLRGLLADRSVLPVWPRVVVPARFSAAEADAFRQLLLGEAGANLHLERNDSLYNRLNGSSQTLIHHIDPAGKEVRRLALTSLPELKHAIAHLRAGAGPYTIERSPCAAPVQLIGYSQLVVGQGQVALLNFARNAVLTLPIAAPCEPLRQCDTAAIGFRALYEAWHGDTIGWSLYQRRHALMLRTVPMPAIRYEALELLPDGLLRTQLAWYQPEKFRYQGRIVDRWVPSYVLADFEPAALRLQPLKAFPAGVYPSGLLHSTPERCRISVEADKPTPTSPRWVDAVPHGRGVRCKAVRPQPLLPPLLTGADEVGQLQPPYVVFESIFHVIDSRTNAWMALEILPTAAAADSLRLLAVERTPAGWRGAVAREGSLHWAFWDAAGRLIDVFSLGLPLEPTKSNYVLDGGQLYWMDARLQLCWLPVSR